MNSKIVSLEKERSELIHKIMLLRQIEISKEKGEEKLAEEILEMKNQINNFRNERKKIENILQDMDKEGKLMLLENNTMESYVNALIQDKKDFKIKENELQKVILEKGIEIQNCMNQNEELNNKIKILEVIIEEKESEFKNLKDSISNFKQDIINLKKSNKDCQRQNEKSIYEIKNDLEIEIGLRMQWEKEASNLKNSLSSVSSKFITLEKTFDRVLQNGSKIISNKLKEFEKKLFISKILNEQTNEIYDNIKQSKLNKAWNIVNFLAGQKDSSLQKYVVENKIEYEEIASKILLSSSSESVYKHKLKIVKKELSDLKSKEEILLSIKSKIKFFDQEIINIQTKVENRQLFSKGWQTQISSLKDLLLNIKKSITNLQKSQSKLNDSPSKNNKWISGEGEGIGKVIRDQLADRPTIDNYDWLNCVTHSVTNDLSLIEFKEMIFIANKEKDDLENENKRIKVNKLI